MVVLVKRILDKRFRYKVIHHKCNCSPMSQFRVACIKRECWLLLVLFYYKPSDGASAQLNSGFLWVRCTQSYLIDCCTRATDTQRIRINRIIVLVHHINFLLSLSYFLYLSTSASGGTPRGRAEELPSDREYTRSVEAYAGIVYMKRRYPENAAVLQSMVQTCRRACRRRVQ